MHSDAACGLVLGCDASSFFLYAGVGVSESGVVSVGSGNSNTDHEVCVCVSDEAWGVSNEAWKCTSDEVRGVRLSDEAS
jgi:hypothetical protein